MKEERLLSALTTKYRELLGELAWIENPPKRMQRAAERERHEAGAAMRAARADQIKEALPHLAHVIRMYDPEWDAAAVLPIRPKAKKAGLPPQGIPAAVFDVLRDNLGRRLTVAEIVDAIADKHDLDVSTVSARQKLHTAVNHRLVYDVTGQVLRDGGRPRRWWLRTE